MEGSSLRMNLANVCDNSRRVIDRLTLLLLANSVFNHPHVVAETLRLEIA